MLLVLTILQVLCLSLVQSQNYFIHWDWNLHYMYNGSFLQPLPTVYTRKNTVKNQAKTTTNSIENSLTSYYVPTTFSSKASSNRYRRKF